MLSMALHAGWKDWYRLQHRLRSSEAGSAFEDYMASVLQLWYDDYINPAPVGRLGDGGCDGVIEGGRVVFACYGTRDRGERHLVTKLEDDFARAAAEWPSMAVWRFVTNASF